MRDAFVSAIYDATSVDLDIICLAGDIGFKVFDRYREDFPQNFINTGIAEANMIGVASGLSTSGYRPVVYTIIPFLVMRAFEQIRVDLAMHKRDVLLVGVGGGYSYDFLGPTHHALEDVAIMEALPNVTTYVPRDPDSVSVLFKSAMEKNNTKYIRLGKNKEPNIPGLNKFLSDSGLESGEILREGNDILIVGRGPILLRATEAAQQLYNHGVSCAILDLPCSELDRDAFIKFAKNYKKILILEEAYKQGSLASKISLILLESGFSGVMKSKNVPHIFNFSVLNHAELLDEVGLSTQNLIQSIEDLIA